MHQRRCNSDIQDETTGIPTEDVAAVLPADRAKRSRASSRGQGAPSRRSRIRWTRSAAALLGFLAVAVTLQAQSDPAGTMSDVVVSTSGSNESCPATTASAEGGATASECVPASPASKSDSPPAAGKPAGNAKDHVSAVIAHKVSKPDFNRNIYYRNKLEFSLESGWLPNNIPFIFDLMIGAGDRLTPLDYTLVPLIASLRWQVDNIGGPSILRGTWDITFSGAYTMIPRGAETRYWSYIMGIRRNFVRPNWRAVPYLDGRVGMGDINARQPYGVPYAQGQDLTFTVLLGGGARYNFNSRYSISGGVTYMHISNLYLSEPKYLNYGINVYGPMVGLNVRLGKARQPSVQ
jgi:Lipid A 3-O-deacylase (PagL)